LKKKKKDMDKMMGRITGQHIAPGREGENNVGLNAAVASYVYDREYRKRQLERPHKQIE
jgi:hypothetical protein